MKLKNIIAAGLLCFSMTAFAQNSGVEYYKAGQLTNAKELLLRNLKNNSDKSTSDYYLGLISLAENNKAQAQKYFEDGITADVENPFNYVGLGRISLLNNDLKTAQMQFKAAEKLDKKNASLMVDIARAYYDADPVNYEKQIEKYVTSARKIDMNNVDLYLFEGDRIFDTISENSSEKNKIVGSAANMYEMAANTNPQATEAYVKYAELFTNINPKFAIQMLNRLLANNPDSALGQRELANAYYNNSDYANAVKAYGSYVKNPNHFKQDEDRYAFLLFYGQNYQDGYDYATEMLKSNPGNFTARRYQLMNAAQIPALADRLPALADELLIQHNADKKNNRFASIDYILINDQLQKSERFDDAIALLEEGVQEVPEQADTFLKQMASIYVDKNNITEASNTFNRYIATTKEPGYNDYIQQAVYYFYSGVENKNTPEVADEKYEAAIQAAKKAAEENPEGYRSYKVMGDVAKQRATGNAIKSAAANDYQKALDLLLASASPERYISDASNMAIYLYAYYTDNGQADKAKAIVKSILAIDPENQTFLKLK